MIALPGWLRRGPRASGFASSTLQELEWQRSRSASLRSSVWGVVLGGLVSLALFAPASWLASAVGRASGTRFLLSDAHGSIWAGNAVAVLTGGPGSRDAVALPSRLHWTLQPRWSGLRLRATQACCLSGELVLDLRLGWNQWRLDLPAQASNLGQWPASWLAGLGTPWNTLQLAGSLRVASSGLSLQSVQGRISLSGGLDVDLLGAGSRLSTLEPLGSYRLALRGANAQNEGSTLKLSTLEGALQLSGSGVFSDTGLRFRGQGRAAEGQEAALANLLNIIGRRQGATSLISIG